MTYNEAYAYIEAVNKMGSVYGLENIKELLRRLDNPQDKLNVIHVAGTNGKGSICAFLENIFKDAGYVTGRYISPVVFTYLERFQVDGEYMRENEFAECMEEVVKVCDDMVCAGWGRPTAFETETAVAFLFFLKRKTDIVLLETGMGGTNDATNVMKKPLCTVFSDISRDHMNFLGNSLPEIFEEKMGIMREGVPSASYMLSKELKGMWLEKCDELNCPHAMADKSKLQIIEVNLDGSSFLYDGEEYNLSMLGIYQIYNSITAIEAVKLLKKTYRNMFDLNYVNIYNGLKNTKWQGRFQKTEDKPLMYVDGAHNEGGWQSLKQNIEVYFQDKDLIYICGVFADKEYEKMVDIMYPYAKCVITVTPENPRALSGDVLADLFKKHIDRAYTVKDILSAKNMAADIASEYENPVILVFGSLSFIGPLIKN